MKGGQPFLLYTLLSQADRKLFLQLLRYVHSGIHPDSSMCDNARRIPLTCEIKSIVLYIYSLQIQSRLEKFLSLAYVRIIYRREWERNQRRQVSGMKKTVLLHPAGSRVSFSLDFFTPLQFQPDERKSGACICKQVTRQRSGSCVEKKEGRKHETTIKKKRKRRRKLTSPEATASPGMKSSG